jgi:ribosomal protein S18 acetylase RimI-like enzyme
MAATAQREAAAVGDRSISVRPTRDRDLLQSYLSRDRLWSAYALCDLEDEEFGRTRWGVAMAADEPISVVLQYTGMTPQPMFTSGDGEGVAAILRDVIRPRAAYVATQTDLLPFVGRHYDISPGPPMLRMWVDAASFKPANGFSLRLTPHDVGELNRLYGLGFTTWLPLDAVARGVYYGVRAGGRLVAAAGTHVISPRARLGIVGNVMTHPEYRGRGLAKLTTSAVTAELLRTCDQVVLNVRSDNPPAIAAYRALGYREHCHFEERIAHRYGAPWGSIVAQLRRLLKGSKENQ